MNRFLKSSLVVAGLLFSVNAVAHPGHGTFAGLEIWHDTGSPMHIGIVWGDLIIMIAGYKVFKARKSSITRK